jgi:TPR repeat protein
MTREQRRVELENLWKAKQINEDCLGTHFADWQGKAAALLGYNPQLQSEFKDAVKLTEKHDGYYGTGPHPLKTSLQRMSGIFAHAINELKFPEEKVGRELTDEHGLKWFWSHSTRGSRLAIAVMFLASLLTAFGIGFRVGATRVGSTLYNQYIIDAAPIPTSAARKDHPTAKPVNTNATNVLTKSLAAQQTETDQKQFDEVMAKAEAGDADSEYQIGVRYAKGQGVAKDEVEAVKWVRKAAEQNYAVAQYNLGVCYSYSVGVDEDDVEAVKWYRKAAEQNYAAAQYNLGNRYASGEGVRKNDIVAYMWWLLAAAQGNEHAKHDLLIMENKMTREQIAEGRKLARDFKPRQVAAKGER